MAFHKLFGKAGTVLLTVVIACNTYATIKGHIKPDKPISSQIKEEVSTKLTDIINDTDFKDNGSIEHMGEMIATVSGNLFGSEDFEEAIVKRVVDGDTIIVNIDGYGDVSVRMIGVNTPESVASEEYLKKKGTTNSREGKDASDFTKDLLKDTDVVYLQKDTSETDPYDRLLRYVWLEVPEDAFSIEEVSDKMVNAILVREGYAEAVYYAPDGMYKEYFNTLEDDLEK